MARRRRTAAGTDSFEDLARKTRILARELSLQRDALDRLKRMAKDPTPPATPPAVRKTA